MKKLLIVIMVIFGISAYATPSDSLKIADLQGQVKQLTDRTAAIENAFVDMYLYKTEKNLGSAFMDFYLSDQQLRAVNENARKMIIEILACKTITEIDAVLEKYGLERK